MKNVNTKLLAGILTILICVLQARAQDSLYMVNSLVGDTVRVLRYAKAAGDINGDGYADLAVTYSDYGDNPSEHTHIYYGNPTFDLTADFTFEDRRILCPGDINNDGYADLISIKTDFEAIKHSTFYMHYGGEEIDSAGQLIYEQQYWDEVFRLETVDPIGDVNNDGYNDFVIASEYNWSDGIGWVYIYFGGDSLNTTPAAVLTADVLNEDYFFGQSVTGIGDQNGDGFDDFIIGTPNAYINDSTSGLVYLYYGGKIMDTTYDRKFNDGDLNFGRRIYRNDSSEYSIIGLYNIFFYANDSLEYKIDGEKYGLGGHVNLGIGGDINNDGYGDYLIGNTNYRNKDEIMVGGVFGFWGSAEIDTFEDFIIEGQQKWSEFGKELDIIGDFNNDGYDDVFAIAASFRQDENKIGKLYLYSIKNVNGIPGQTANFPKSFYLYQNYPNPFNNTTIIPFYLHKPEKIELNIYDVQGRLVRMLFSGKKTAGGGSFTWDGKNDTGTDSSSGIYFYQIRTRKSTQTKKMLLIE